MDLLLRNRTPNGSYERKILKDRRANDERESLAKHLREEELLRLNNSWYSKQNPPSTSSRPYGVFNDILPSSGRPMSNSTSSSSSSPVFLRNSSPQQQRGNNQQLSPSHQLLHTTYHRNSPILSSRTSPRPIQPPTLSPSSSSFLNSKEESNNNNTSMENEYVSTTTKGSFSKMRKANELSGYQVAQLLGGGSSSYNNRKSPTINYTTYHHHSEQQQQQQQQQKLDLLSQMKYREEEEQRIRKLEIEFEQEQVKSTLLDAKTRLNFEEDTRLAKQEEAYRFLQESQRLQRENYLKQKQLEEAAEKLARLEREALDSKRAEETAKIRLIIQQKMSYSPRQDSISMLLSGLEPDSVIYEAANRLLQAHSHELDIVGPLIHEILSEPEFS